MAGKRYPPQLYSYLKKYQDDPDSKVFAPLAEAYRKAGLIDEALEIAREGVARHPNFVSGKVALARALFDKKDFDAVIESLAPVIHDVPDNLVAQRLLAESYLMIGRTIDSLNCYKMLLFFMPTDQETAKIVQELESVAYDNGTIVLRTDTAKESGFEIKGVSGAIAASPDSKRALWIKKVERLQHVLQNVERYRNQV